MYYSMLAILVGVGVFIPIGAYLTHLVWATLTLMNSYSVRRGQITLSVLGTLFPPIGILHGIALFVSRGGLRD